MTYLLSGHFSQNLSPEKQEHLYMPVTPLLFAISVLRSILFVFVKHAFFYHFSRPTIFKTRACLLFVPGKWKEVALIKLQVQP